MSILQPSDAQRRQDPCDMLARSDLSPSEGRYHLGRSNEAEGAVGNTPEPASEPAQKSIFKT